MAEDAQAERERERKAFQLEKEGLLHELQQAQAGEIEADKKIADLKDRVQ